MSYSEAAAAAFPAAEAFGEERDDFLEDRARTKLSALVVLGMSLTLLGAAGAHQNIANFDA